ncbi:hypothetical protein DERP_012494 [Dermatophagoides pteronyssinus]|uniref:Uncharacterized protein n=1 Tax=Dermatophagoides pteronyssinus TaxID=6956 RepID=A0ABQ8IXB7_DERPT|nr:hypothetical protein DERP_012494 [Dermatophagoides pteronyssinus]
MNELNEHFILPIRLECVKFLVRFVLKDTNKVLRPLLYTRNDNFHTSTTKHQNIFSSQLKDFSLHQTFVSFIKH